MTPKWPIRESVIERGLSALLRANREQLRRLEDRSLDQAVAKLSEVDPAEGAVAAFLVADHRRRRAEDDLAEAALRRFWLRVGRGAP